MYIIYSLNLKEIASLTIKKIINLYRCFLDLNLAHLLGETNYNLQNYMPFQINQVCFHYAWRSPNDFLCGDNYYF